MTTRTKARLPVATLLIYTILGFLLLAGCGQTQELLIRTVTFPLISTEHNPTITQQGSTPLPTLTAFHTSTPTILLQTATLSITPSTTLQPDNWFSVGVESLKVWDDPASEGDYWSLQTELITGERVLVLAQQGNWSQIVAVEQPSLKDPRGYPGWVRSKGLSRGWLTGDRFAIVMVRSTILHEEESQESKRIMKLHLDTRLPVVNEKGNMVQVLLPDGRQGWLPAGDIRLANNREDTTSTDGIYETARSLVSIPYVWGGTTSDSMDCAGFLYRLFHAYGITLARDANDQAVSGEAVDANALQRGQLAFTSDRPNGPITHVAMYWGDGQIIDAEPERGVSIHPLAELMKTAFMSVARTYLP